jgi:adenylosuccinate lyase
MATADHPLLERYASREMVELFAPAARVRLWRELWCALAETQRELGVEIPEAAIREMRESLDRVDFARVAELERELRHDVMAHVRHYGEVAPAARPYLHLGATSADITDNADLIQQRRALDLLRRRVVRCLAALREFAWAHRGRPTLGFTHFQPAQPTTVGKRAALWIQDLLLDLEELDDRIARLAFRGFRGATGTEASFLELFGGDARKVDAMNERIARRFGFDRIVPVTGQTYPRKMDAALLATLAGIGVSASKFGHDVRLLQHLGELEEPAEPGQVGSSAMPYKRNPVRAERLCALARHAVILALDPAWTAATQWLERTLDDSANRRIAIPEAFWTADAVLVLLHDIAAGLAVREAAIERRLRDELPFLLAERILVEGVRRGGDRQDLHERLRRHAWAARDGVARGERNDLWDRIAADPAFGLTREELEAAADPARLVGRAREQVERFLREHVDPVLERYRDALGEPAPEVRV